VTQFLARLVWHICSQSFDADECRWMNSNRISAVPSAGEKEFVVAVDRSGKSELL